MGDRVIASTIGLVVDRQMTRSPDLQSLLCFLGELSDLALSSFFVSFDPLVSLESFPSLSSAELLSPSDEEDEDDDAELAPFFA
jgi:hypothetical protein